MYIIKKMLKNIVFFICTVYLSTSLVKGSNNNERKPYIVYMGDLPEDTASISAVDHHHNLLTEVIGNGILARESRIHSYGRSLNGFVARLLPHEAAKLSENENVVSVFPNTVQKLLTTRSWDFLGMSERVRRNQEVESNTIVALLDSGVWVESPSFDDEGYGPPPAKWKGKCDKGVNFTKCNNKVIGAQYFNLANSEAPEDATPVDVDGHGTHTASTAAGRVVEGANLYTLASGTARGGVPSARIASYKVCWGVGCQDMDLLAAFDAAIADGVDIISVSIGGSSRRFFEDPIAIGSFHAIKKGILTSCAAGNEGPDLQTVENVAPWILTVAASAIDRRFITPVKLGNGEVYTGVSINTFQPRRKMYSLISGAQAGNVTDSFGNSSACDYGTLGEKKVRGKLVFCLGDSGQDTTIKELGGAGTILSDDVLIDTPLATIIPSALISIKDGKHIGAYINSTKSPTAIIYRSKTVKGIAPFIASFSSRGPQLIALNILKPDVAAPGVSILAAYSELTSVTGSAEDNRVAKYNIESGTSMATPHVAGAAAYLKTLRPGWSPAAIKSALMTTARAMKIKPEEGALASGSGQIRPTKALHPGLIYDLDTESYISFLCKEGYNGTMIALLTGIKGYNCSSVKPAKGADGLNYPSMHLQLKNSYANISAVFYRTVTNVGVPRSVYKATVKSPKGLSIKVVPNILSFTRKHQKRSFKVILEGSFVKDRSLLLSGSLVWTDLKHRVKTTIFVYRGLY